MRSTITSSILALVIFGLVSGIPIYFASRNLYQDEQFDQSPLTSQATIEHSWTTTGKKGSRHYHVRYHFMDDHSRQWTVSTPIAPETYWRLHSRDVVPVKYLADDPGQSRVDWPEEDQYHWRQDEFLLGIGLVIGGIGILLLVSKRR